MNLHNLKIGARLGAGFGVILLLASAMLAGAMLGNAVSRSSMLQSLQEAAVMQDEAVAMRTALLSSAVSIRNMGLQTTVDKVQQDEAQARKEFANYLAAKKRLQGLKLDAQERAFVDRLAPIDRDMELSFKEAVDLNSLLNSEQAAVVITTKIDPLLNKAMAELEWCINKQKQDTADAIASANANNLLVQRMTAGAGVLVLVLAVLIAWRLTLSITRPMQRAVAVAQRVAAGDLTAVAEVSGKDETALLLQALQDMNTSLGQIVAEVRSGTDTIATASGEVAAGNADLSQRTEEQASSLEETASSMEELTSTVKQNAENAGQANQLAARAAEVAVTGGEVVGQVVTTMGAINDSSKKIADIIGVIDGIAFQTNILALNAAVEAARAGEQGRGFAVVAAEVRNLAQRSAAAAKEIKELIQDSVSKVDSGSRLVNQAGKSMDEVVTAIKRVSDIMAEITAASQEQSSGIEQVNQAVTQMDQVTQQNAALVEEAAAAAESMQQRAQQLSKAVSVFKLDARAATHSSQAAPSTGIAPVRAEQREPKRAEKVTRLPTKAAAPAARPVATASVAKTGTNDEWTEF